MNSESLRQQFRDICISAAVDGHPTVLIISSSTDLGRQQWEDVYKLMNEGKTKGTHKLGISLREMAFLAVCVHFTFKA